MKKIILFTYLSLGFLTSFSQQKQHKAGGISLVKFSINSSNLRTRLTTDDDFNTSKGRIGYGFGLERLVPIKKGSLYLNAQVALNSLGYKSVRTTYINTPVTINFFLGKQKLYYMGIGMYGGYLVKAKFKNNNDDWTKMKIGDDITDNRTRFDYGIAYTLAFTFGEGFPIIQMNIMKGMNNLIPMARQTNGAKNKMNTIELSIRLPLSDMSTLKN